jgi:exopolysaccharide biosynthesis polyprenyl glycosylphosphotransferase
MPLRKRARLLDFGIRLTDAGLVAASFWLTLEVLADRIPFDPSLPGKLLALGLSSAIVWVLSLHALGTYGSQRRSGARVFAATYLRAGAIATAAIGAGLWLLGIPLPLRYALIFGAVQTLVLLAQRTAIYAVLRFLRRSGHNTRYVLIAGTGPRAERVYRSIQLHPSWGIRVIGLLDEVDSPVDPGIPPDLVHKLSELPALIDRAEPIDEVIVACPRAMLDAFRPLVQYCAMSGTPLTLLSDLFGDFLPPPRITHFDQQPALSFSQTQHDPFRIAVKRGIDIAGSAILLALSAPLLALAALAIRLSSPGPVLFRQVRCGLHGRRFEMIKLRTMVTGAEEMQGDLRAQNQMSGPVFKIDDDPRVTRIGRWLRRFSIDELPQLLHVLRGDMSLVGPRPPVPSEVSLYEITDRRRLSMRPGLTCTWQVSGRNLIRDFDEWVKLDLEYIDNWSLTRDLELLLRTIPAVLRGTGAR